MRTRISKLSIITACVIYLSLLPSIAAQPTTIDPVATHFANFHFQTNQLVNNKISEFTKLTKTFKSSEKLPDDFQSKLAPPTTLDTQICATNLSASCLQFQINQEFIDLTNRVQQELSSISLSNSNNLTTTNINQNQSQRITFIETELENINNSVEQSLLFYQQLLVSLPLHKTYELSQAELETYIQNLQKLETYIQKYPSKYNNVTTPYCQ